MQFPYPCFMVMQELARTDRYDVTQVGGKFDLRRELARVLVSEPPSPFVRGEIVDSWRQSVALGLVPHRFDLPYDGCLEEDSPLARAAEPVVDRLGADLAFTEISVVLCGESGCIVARRAPGPLEEAQLDELTFSPGYLWGMENAGTNGLSGAFANGSPLLVQGDEHFADVLTTIATAGAPIRDPCTAQVLGVLALVCSEGSANPLLLPVVSRAVREVEQRLLKGSLPLDSVVEESFLIARRRTRGLLAAVSSRTLLTNAAAARLFTVADRPRLWDFASCNLGIPGKINPLFTLADGRTFGVSLEAILDGGEVAGALVRFTPTHESSRRPTHSSRSRRPTFGWDSLTDAEHSVTELVADGLTNREVAARLFLSPHTVDSHLRHIFRKLDINSRVDLVRIVTVRSVANRAPIGAAEVA